MKTTTSPTTAPKPMGTLDKLRTLAKPTKGQQIEPVPLDDLIPDPNQPRSRFRPVDGQIAPEVMADLRELADDIDANGQLQAIVYRIVDGQKMIVLGERRWRAKKLNRELGRPNSDHVDGVWRQDLTAETLRLAQLSENLQRDDLTDIETAVYIKNLLEEFPDLKKKDIGTVFHKNSQYVSRILAMLDPKWNDVIVSGAIQFASLLEQYRPLPEKQKAELRELAKAEGRPLTSGDIRAAKVRAEAEAADASQGARGPGADSANDSAVGGERNAEDGMERQPAASSQPTGSQPMPPANSPAGPAKLDDDLANQVTQFLAESSPAGESYRPSASATQPKERPNHTIKDTGGDFVMGQGPAGMNPAIHEKREVKMTLAQLEKLLVRGALAGKGHQVSVMLPVDEVKRALVTMGVPLPEDDSSAVMNLLEAVNKM
jgi:ParB family chromosome partitioning protein